MKISFFHHEGDKEHEVAYAIVFLVFLHDLPFCMVNLETIAIYIRIWKADSTYLL